MKLIIFLAIVGVALFFVHKFMAQFKFPKVGAIAMFSGGVKCGKSAVSLSCAFSNYKQVHRRWWIKSHLFKFFNKTFWRKKPREVPEEPLFYSSIPLNGIKYCPVTRAHLLRKVRFNYGSVVFIDEASLVADSQLIKDKEINTQLLLFFKLFGHSTRGGKCIFNSHCITDLHYALKRTISEYYYIHHLSNFLWWSCALMREERYSEDGTTVNNYSEDVEKTMLKCIFSRKVFKQYDSFCFSVFTDDKPKKNNIIYNKDGSLKCDKLLSFRPEFVELGVKNNEKKNN